MTEPVPEEQPSELLPEPLPELLPEPVAKVIGPLPNAWHLVQFGSWEISVDPNGMLMLPRSLHPDEAMDFSACARAAAEVGQKIRVDNAERAARLGGDGLPVGALIIREGPPPVGAMRLPVSTIGRQRSRQGRLGR